MQPDPKIQQMSSLVRLFAASSSPPGIRRGLGKIVLDMPDWEASGWESDVRMGHFKKVA